MSPTERVLVAVVVLSITLLLALPVVLTLLRTLTVELP